MHASHGCFFNFNSCEVEVSRDSPIAMFYVYPFACHFVSASTLDHARFGGADANTFSGCNIECTVFTIGSGCIKIGGQSASLGHNNLHGINMRLRVVDMSAGTCCEYGAEKEETSQNCHSFFSDVDNISPVDLSVFMCLQ